MTKKMCVLVLLLAIISGFCGGLVGQRLYNDYRTVNTSESIIDGELSVRRLNIVDKDNNSRIQLFGDESGGTIFIMNGGDSMRVGASLGANHIMLFTGIMEPRVSIGVAESGGYIVTKDSYGIPDPR